MGEQLVYLAQLKGMDLSPARDSVRRWLDRFDALDWAGKKTEELSKGQQQKIQFISTIVHDPELVILDEPFSGLDPLNADLLTTIIGELREAGKTVLFASHRMESVEQLCDDLCLMANGRVVLSAPASGGEAPVRTRHGDRSLLRRRHVGAPTRSRWVRARS